MPRPSSARPVCASMVGSCSSASSRARSAARSTRGAPNSEPGCTQAPRPSSRPARPARGRSPRACATRAICRKAAGAYTSQISAWCAKVGAMQGRTPAPSAGPKPAPRARAVRASRAAAPAAQLADSKLRRRAGSPPSGAASRSHSLESSTHPGKPGGCGTPVVTAAAASSPESSKPTPGAAKRAKLARATAKTRSGACRAGPGCAWSIGSSRGPLIRSAPRWFAQVGARPRSAQ